MRSAELFRLLRVLRGFGAVPVDDPSLKRGEEERGHPCFDIALSLAHVAILAGPRGAAAA